MVITVLLLVMKPDNPSDTMILFTHRQVLVLVKKMCMLNADDSTDFLHYDVWFLL